MRPNICSRDPLSPRRTWIISTLLYDVFLHSVNLTYEVLPLGVQVRLVGQAALHHVGAVVGAGFDGGHAATVGAEDQLHQGPHALRTQRHLGRVDRIANQE